ncbi:MAG: hypothetical protein KAU29_08070 [Gammaproteobacteria bacterium]|nr:hypothetical protein [Gammaproteobacteria bacterium]
MNTRAGRLHRSVIILAILIFSSVNVLAEPVSNANGRSDLVVVMGASYAGEWKPGNLTGRPVINKGVGGNETGQMLERFQTDVIDLKPDTVIIWGFINDIFRADPQKYEEAIRQIQENYIAMVDLAKNNGVTPLLATEVTITSPDTWSEKIMGFIGKLRGKKGYADYINTHVMETNTWLREYAARKNLDVLDFEKVLADKNGVRKQEYAAEDGSHLSKEAYDTLTSYVHGIKIKL